MLITSPFNALLNWFFIYKLNMGLLGAPFATGISYWLSFFLLVLYAIFVKGKECWGGLAPRSAFSHMVPFARLAVLGVIHVGSEWLAFEIVALAAGRLGTISLAAQSVIMTADQIINTVPFGLGVAASSRIGNLLGARKPKEAARAAHCAAILSIAAGGLILGILMGVKDVFGKIFNDDERVVRLVAEVMPYVALFQVCRLSSMFVASPSFQLLPFSQRPSPRLPCRKSINSQTDCGWAEWILRGRTQGHGQAVGRCSSEPPKLLLRCLARRHLSRFPWLGPRWSVGRPVCCVISGWSARVGYRRPNLVAVRS